MLKNPQPKTTAPQVRLPDNSIIQPTLFGHLLLLTLPSVAIQSHSYPNLKSASLLSIVKLCDSDCYAVFIKNDVTIFNSDNTSVINGKINTSDGLWGGIITSSQSESYTTAPTTPNANSVFRLHKTKSELASYLHAGCPTKSIFIQAMNNGDFITWPGLNSNLISKHLTLSLPTLKSHFEKEQQNICSKTLPTKYKLEYESPPNQKSKTQGFFTLTTKEAGKIFRSLWKISDYF